MISCKPRSWTPQEFAAFNAISFNRNVDRHAAQLVADGIDPKDPTYRVGYMTATLRGSGTTFRVNGNTRERLTRPPYNLPLPARLDGHDFECDNMEEVFKIYEKVDNKISVKQAVDRLYSVFDYLKMPVTSKLFSRGKGTSGLSVMVHAMRGRESNGAPKNLVGALGEKSVRNTVMAIDGVLTKCEVSPHEIATHVGVIAAMGLTYIRTFQDLRKRVRGVWKPEHHGKLAHNEWAAYWEMFHLSKGKFEGTGTSPFNAAWAAVREEKGESQRKVVYAIAGKLIDCFERRDSERIQKISRRSITDYAPILRKKFKAEIEREATEILTVKGQPAYDKFVKAHSDVLDLHVGM